MSGEGEVVDAGLRHQKVEDEGDGKDVKARKHRKSEEDGKHKHHRRHRHKHREDKKHRRERKEDEGHTREGKEKDGYRNRKVHDDLEEGQIAEEVFAGNDSDIESGEIKMENKASRKSRLREARESSQLVVSCTDGISTPLSGKMKEHNEGLHKENRVSVKNGEPVALQSMLNIASTYDSDGEGHIELTLTDANAQPVQKTAKQIQAEEHEDRRSKEGRLGDDEEKRSRRKDRQGKEGRVEDAEDKRDRRKDREGREKEGGSGGGKEKNVEVQKTQKEDKEQGKSDEHDKQTKVTAATERSGVLSGRNQGKAGSKVVDKEEMESAGNGKPRERGSHKDASAKEVGCRKTACSAEKLSKEDSRHREKRGSSQREVQEVTADARRDAKRPRTLSPGKESGHKLVASSPLSSQMPPLGESQERKHTPKSAGSPKEAERIHRKRSRSKEGARESGRDQDRSLLRDRGIDQQDHSREAHSSAKGRDIDGRGHSRPDRSLSRDRHMDERDYRRRDRSASSDRRIDYRRDREYTGLRDSRSRADSKERSHRASSRARDRENRIDRHHEDRRERDRDGQRREGRDTSRRDRDDQEKQAAAREEENEEEYARRVATQLKAQEEEEDPEKIKEESRRRRQAILEKYKKQQQEETKGISNGAPALAGLAKEDGAVAASTTMLVNGKEGEAGHGRLGSLTAGSTDAGMVTHPAEVDKADAISAADAAAYVEKPALVANGQLIGEDAGLAAQGRADGSVPAGHAAETADNLAGNATKRKASMDMFADDMFGESPAGGQKLARTDGAAPEVSGLTDNWDDAEGYYTFRIGEILDGRYEVASSHGRGVFSTVVRAWDLKAGPNDPGEVAIKIIRNNETMFKAGQQELVILNKLSGADPENRRHCIRLYSSFEYRQHLCLVFESLHMNLREILKKFGRNIGINLAAVRSYAAQLLISLKHLRNCGVLHCDIKPDNMLVNEAKNVLKLADFGSAMFAGENEITPYLVSRFYRAPEIMLGLPYDHALDMWSVGCCLYEMYTGKILFPGRTNNDMLRLHMELKGLFPKKLLKKASFVEQHFDTDYNFCAIEEDPVTKKPVKRIITNVHPKDVGALLPGPGSSEEDPKMAAAFKDLLDKMFVLDPAKRINVSQALSHSFILGK